MRIIPGNAQHIGTRNEQQDSFGFSDIDDAEFVAHGGVIAVLADGMGGMAMGRECSQTTVTNMLRWYRAKSPTETIPQTLYRILNQVNHSVFDLADAAGVPEDAGSTLVAVVAHGAALFWVSVGDSRLYLFRKKKLKQLTVEHTYGRVLDQEAARGNITREKARGHIERSALTSFIGLAELNEVDRNEKPFPLEHGDWIILTSDGIHGALTNEKMITALAGNPQTAAETLVQMTLAERRPHQDNLTVAIMAIENETGSPGANPLRAVGNFIKQKLKRKIANCDR